MKFRRVVSVLLRYAAAASVRTVFAIAASAGVKIAAPSKN
jgi:hypothetical protein